MIVYNRADKKISVPRGLGNVSVDVMSGSTDTISEEQVARMISTSASAVMNYASVKASEALEDANAYTDSAITNINRDIFLNPDSFDYWEAPVENIDNLFALTDRLGHVYSGNIRVFIRCDGREVPLEFHIINIADNDMDILWIGQTYEDMFYHPTTLRIRRLSLVRGQAIQEGSMYDTLLIEERVN